MFLPSYYIYIDKLYVNYRFHFITEVVVLPKNVPPLPKEVVKQTETEFLMTLPALQDKG